MLGLDRDLWLLFILNMAVGFSNQLIRPLFPLYLESLHASELEIGLVISIARIAATAFARAGGYYHREQSPIYPLAFSQKIR